MLRLSLIMQELGVDANFLLQDEMEEYEASKQAMSAEETKLLDKYRGLDEHGKRLVEMVVDAEEERCREEQNKSRPMLRLTTMPVYDDPAAAGEPLNAESEYEYVDFNADDVPAGAKFGVRISGESMGNTVPDGCIAFIRRTERAHNNDIVIAWVEGEGMVCKRVVANGEHLTRLHSDNPAYPDITGSRLNGLHIYGVVLGHTE